MKNIGLIILFVVLFSCNKEKIKVKKENNFTTVSGIIKNMPDSTLIRIIGANNKITDSVYAKDNSFKITSNFNSINNDGVYFISFLNKKREEIYSIDVWIENDIVLNGDINNKNYGVLVQRNKNNEVLRKFRELSIKYDEQINKKMSNETDPNKIKIFFDNIIKLIIDDQKVFLMENSNNTFALNEFLRMNKHFSKDSSRMFYSRLDDNLKISKNGKILKECFTQPKVKVGESFIDFEAKNINGKSVKFSDYKGKIIILDFWANWCKWCHVQNKKEFPALLNKFGDNIVIVSYALDKNIVEWKESSENDNISWINLANLKGTKDPIAYQYGAFSLPKTFLIDKDGTVIKEYEGYNGNNLIEKDIIILLE